MTSEEKHTRLLNHDPLMRGALVAWTFFRTWFSAEMIYFVSDPTTREIRISLEYPDKPVDIRIGVAPYGPEEAERRWNRICVDWNTRRISDDEIYRLRLQSPYAEQWPMILMRMHGLGIKFPKPQAPSASSASVNCPKRSS
jgi:hypothetical protein